MFIKFTPWKSVSINFSAARDVYLWFTSSFFLFFFMRTAIHIHVTKSVLIRENETKKRKVHEDESGCCSVTMLSTWDDELRGAAAGIVKPQVTLSARPLTAERHRSPAGWQRTLPISTHIIPLWQGLASKTRLHLRAAGKFPSGLWIYAKAENSPNVYGVHVV